MVHVIIFILLIHVQFLDIPTRQNPSANPGEVRPARDQGPVSTVLGVILKAGVAGVAGVNLKDHVYDRWSRSIYQSTVD